MQRCWLKCQHLPLASPFNLPDNEIDLDVSFSQKVPVGALSCGAMLELILYSPS